MGSPATSTSIKSAWRRLGLTFMLAELDLPHVLIGSLTSDFAVLQGGNRLDANHPSPAARSWVSATIDLQLGGIRAEVHTQLDLAALEGFRDQLAKLNRTLEGEAIFEQAEGALSMRVYTNVLGHLLVDFTI